MNKKEFIEEVKAKCPEHLEPYVPTAVDMLGDMIEYERWKIATVIQFIGRWHSCQYKLVDTPDKSREIEPTASSQLTTEFLIYKITPWVEKTREKLFHSKESPFKTKKEASRWIKDVYTKNQVQLEAYGQKLEAYGQKLKACEQRARNGEQPLEVIEELHGLPEISKFKPSDEFIFIMREAKEISKVIGESFYDVTLYVLTGDMAVFPRLHVYTEEEMRRIPFGEEVVTRVAKVEIRDALSFDEFRSLRNVIRSKLGVSRMKPFSERDLKLFRIVRDSWGPVRGKGAVAYWKSVNQALDSDACQTWKGARLAYDRLEKKLINQYLAKEA